jgi:hypothetical protein
MFRRRPDLSGKALWLVELLALLVLLLCVGNAVVFVVALLRSLLG